MEADNHLAALWMATRGDGPWIAWPVGDPRPVQDFVHVPPAAMSMWIDPAFGYGLVLLLDVIVGLFGGWGLAREAGASREGALVGMIVVGTAPFVGGAAVFGLSEAWPIGWFALHGALLLRTARTGSVRDGLGAGLCLAAYALSGWYAATFAALAAPVWLAWIGSRGDRRGWGLVIGAGLLAVVLVMPALAIFLHQGDAAGLVARGVPAWEPRVDWRHGSGFGADPLQFVLPGTSDIELARTVYLGVVALVLGLIGARRAPWAAVGLLWMCVLALGPWAQIAGRPIGAPLSLPAAWLSWAIPPLQGIAGWYRAAGPAVVFLAPLAGLGASYVVERTRPWVSYVLALLVLFDGLVLSDAPWPRPQYEARPPEALLALDGDGPLVLLPFDEGGRGRIYHRWLPYLRRPISEHYEGPDPLRSDAVIGWLQASCGASVGRSRWPEPAPPASQPAPDALTKGIDWIVVLRDRARPSCVPAATRLLGDPDVVSEDVVAWKVE